MIVLVGFIVFLLSLYLFTREDFVFVRKNVSIEDIFDTAFLTALVALFFARSIFVALHFKTTYLNPLVFFLIPYFPGLDISGTIFGGFFFLLWVARRKKIPLGHIVDVFSVSFLYAFSTTLLGYSIMSFVHRQLLAGIVNGVWGIISLALAILFGSILMKSMWKDWSMTAVVVAVLSIVLLIIRSVLMFFQKPFMLDKELVIIFLLLVGAGVLGIGRKFIQRSML